MNWTQSLRARLCRPLLKALAAARITPDQLTVLALLSGLAFCPLFFWSKPAAFLALGLHVLLDGLDGPLARHTGRDSARGSFADTMSDQIVVIASTIALMISRVVGIAGGGAYIFLYTVVVGFAMIRNALSIPYSWLIRPRFAVFVWFAVETWIWPGSIDAVIWTANALLAMKLVTGFVSIRRRL